MLPVDAATVNTLATETKRTIQGPLRIVKMSGAAQGDNATTQAVVSDSKDTSKPLQPQKPAAQLEEDDEFEDFPVEGIL